MTADVTLSQAAGVRRSSTYLPELEALRGVAITLVFLHHAIGMVEGAWGTALGKVHVSLPRAFFVAGSTGVTLFFVLSAFLLALPFLAEAEGGKRVRRQVFYERRALRILPLYWTVVLGATLLKAEHPADMAQALPFLVFFGGYAIDALSPYSGVWWSLYTEAQFYVLLPLLGHLRTRPGRWIGIGVLVMYLGTYASFLRVGTAWIPAPTHLLISHSLFGMAPAFGWGILAAWLYRRHGTRLRAWAEASRLARGGGSDVVLLVILILLGLLLQALLWRGLGLAELDVWHAWHVLEALLWAAVVLLVVLAPLRTKPLICNRVLELVGVLSYSIYLLHVPVLLFGLGPLRRAGIVPMQGWSVPTIGAMVLLAGACLAMATLTYTTIERPFLVRKARLDT